MTFDDFLIIARERYGVFSHRLRTSSGIDSVVLSRPAWSTPDGMEDSRCCPRPRLQLDAKMPSETISRVCDALKMKPADFDLFIG